MSTSSPMQIKLSSQEDLSPNVVELNVPYKSDKLPVVPGVSLAVAFVLREFFPAMEAYLARPNVVFERYFRRLYALFVMIDKIFHFTAGPVGAADGAFVDSEGPADPPLAPPRPPRLPIAPPLPPLPPLEGTFGG